MQNLKKIYGLYCPNRHILEISGDVNYAGQPNDKGIWATQPVDCWKAEFRNFVKYNILSLNKLSDALFAVLGSTSSSPPNLEKISTFPNIVFIHA